MTLGSLFDGSGGFPLAGLLSGIEPVWASEIEPFPIRVTTKRLPGMKHLGDVSKVDGGKVEPVDIITFGSPCQDMSLAGRHAGLDGARSGLFREAIRIIKEMKEATNGRYPKYAVWENVPGAFSSNGGDDFRAVLEAFARAADSDADIPRPEKWSRAGYILGEGFSVAWRLLDAQFWGVPQRRKRIFLVADFGGDRAPKILFESEGLSRYSSAGFGAWKEFARDFEGSVGKAGKYINLEFNPSDARLRVVEEDVSQTLKARMGTGGGQVPLIITDEVPFHANTRDELINLNGIAGSLLATKGDRMQTYLASLNPVLNDQGGGEMSVTEDMTGTLRAQTHGHPPVVLNDQGGERMDVTDEVTVTLRAQSHHPPAVLENETFSIQGSTINRKLENGANGKGGDEDVSFTLNTIDRHAVCTASGEERDLPPLAYGMEPEYFLGGKFMPGLGEEVQPTLSARHEGFAAQQYAIRSLTPVECARLQGFPDRWCANLGEENPLDEEMTFWRKAFDEWCDINGMKHKTDAQIRRWLKNPYTEAAEYKMWGNGVALPCVWFVLEGIVWAEGEK